MRHPSLGWRILFSGFNHLNTKMTEQDIYRRSAEAYTALDQGGITQKHKSLSRKYSKMRSMQDSLSKKSTQVYMTNEAAGDEVFQNTTGSREFMLFGPTRIARQILRARSPTFSSLSL
jgi:hypothetical protein